jgi:hypothetical protein
VDELKLTDAELKLAARRMELLPPSTLVEFARFERNESQWFAGAIALLDAWPEGVERPAKIEPPAPVQTSLDDPEPPETMHPDWSKQHARGARELPLVVEQFMREQGWRS